MFHFRGNELNLMNKIIIAAVAKNRIIGKAGIIPWYSSNELRHFKETTVGYPLIMGRKTFESLKKPLQSRINIVISTKPNLGVVTENVKFFNGLEKAYQYCTNELKSGKVFIIGGGEIFDQTIVDADEMIISLMNFEVEGDVYFPEIDFESWVENSRKIYDDFDVIIYKRKNNQ
jgi:dihydrofolate reductase